MNVSYVRDRTGSQPYKVSHNDWRLEVDGVTFTTNLIKDTLAIKNLYEKFWSWRREQVFERDQYKCRMCGGNEALSVDHIVARSQGGTDEMSNLRLLCFLCHSKRHGWGK